jgi:hypothetical protein
LTPTNSNPRSLMRVTTSSPTSIGIGATWHNSQPSSPNRSRPNSPVQDPSDFLLGMHSNVCCHYLLLFFFIASLLLSLTLGSYLVGSVGAEEGIEESSNATHFAPSSPSNPSPISAGGFQFNSPSSSGHLASKSRQTGGRIGNL